LQAPRLIIDKKGNSELLRLFPNPVNDEILHVELLDAANSTGMIQITDLLGKTIFHQTIERANTTDQVVKIMTNSWDKGQYHLLYQSKSSDGKLYQVSKPFTVR